MMCLPDFTIPKYVYRLKILQYTDLKEKLEEKENIIKEKEKILLEKEHVIKNLQNQIFKKNFVRIG